MNTWSGRDLISDLPVGIIEIILTFLPIRDAIKTSILSTKWRYIWNSLPQLVFDEDTMGYSRTGDEDPIYKKCIQNFVTCTLLRHQGPIHKFEFLDITVGNYPKTKKWLLSLSRKDIKELTLGVGDYGGYFNVPCSVYSCRNLTFLKLIGCEFGPPPRTFKGFLCLRTLILEVVEVLPGTIESIVANSPLLEHFGCAYIYSEFSISAPNLKSFRAQANNLEIHLCAPLLAKLDVTLVEENCYLADLLEKEGIFCNYTKFLGGVTNIESLTGGELFTKYLSIGIQYCDPPLVFHRLKDITLSKVNFLNVNELLVVVRLIMDTTNLHELQVGCSPYKSADELNAPHKDFWEKECPQNCRFENLKLIKITDFRALLHETKFIKFLLESSPVLEAVSVELFRCPIQQEILDSIVELLSYPRASSNAKILFKIMQMPSLRR